MSFFMLEQNEEKSGFIQPFIWQSLLIELVLNYFVSPKCSPVLDRKNKLPASRELQAEGSLRWVNKPMQKIHPKGRFSRHGSRVLWEHVIHALDPDLRSPEALLEEVTPKLPSLAKSREECLQMWRPNTCEYLRGLWLEGGAQGRA